MYIRSFFESMHQLLQALSRVKNFRQLPNKTKATVFVKGEGTLHLTKRFDALLPCILPIQSFSVFPSPQSSPCYREVKWMVLSNS